MEVRRLDERHREDRRRLGLPDILPPVTTGVKQRSGGGGRRKQADRDKGADPDLELAALTISASAGKHDPEDGGDGLTVNKAPSLKRTSNMWLPPAQIPNCRKEEGEIKEGSDHSAADNY